MITQANNTITPTLFARLAILICTVVAIAVPQSAFSETKRSVESLAFYIPDSMGYRKIYSDRAKGHSLLELAARGQNTKNWREMLSVQTFELGVIIPKSASTDQMYAAMHKAGTKSCPRANTKKLGSSRYKGHKRLIYRSYVPCASSNLPEEWVLGLIFKGETNVFVTTKSWRKEPTKVQLRQWQDLMSTCFICATTQTVKECVAAFPKE